MTGAQIKAERERLGVSPEELAAAMGVSWWTVYRRERRETSGRNAIPDESYEHALNELARSRKGRRRRQPATKPKRGG